ncbi:methylesterase 10-like [Cornus florida]|uniref:methylesterase 10-like n=1 Tax=Cornus florida TaxID=4283 RepID=UPI00289ACFE0|nr:methylesterase 10-like [Cornus florida]
MASLPDGEKVALVGHSYGGFSISLAMERFPEKISVAVFLTAFMPYYTWPPAMILGAAFKSNPFMDLVLVNDSNHKPVSVHYGPQFLATKLYNDSPTKDLELGKMLVRPTRFYVDDLVKNLLTEKNFGSVTRVFIISGDDQMLPVHFQKYMIKYSPPKEVKHIAGSDHMVMISKPFELYISLQQIADKYN